MYLECFARYLANCCSGNPAELTIGSSGIDPLCVLVSFYNFGHLEDSYLIVSCCLVSSSIVWILVIIYRYVVGSVF